VSLADRCFVVLMFVMTGTVAWVGTLAYREGQRTEAAKANGEYLVSWLEVAGRRRHGNAFEPMACAGELDSRTPQESTVASNATGGGRWDACWWQLTAPGGPLAGLSDPFDGGALKLAVTCDHKQSRLPGAIVIERLVGTPPGSALPYVVVPLAPGDSIAEEIKLRVTICDKGGYPIVIGEAGF